MLCANKRTLLFGSSLLAGSDTSLTTDSKLETDFAPPRECSSLFVQSIKSSLAEIELVVMRYANPCGNTAYRVLEGATSPVIFANANQIT